MASICVHYINLYGKSQYKKVLDKKFERELDNTGYFNMPKENNLHITRYFFKYNLKSILRNQIYLFPKLYSNYKLFLYLYTLERVLFLGGIKVAIKILYEYFIYLIKFKKRPNIKYQSLRKTVFDLTNQFETENVSMRPLRKGRW